MKKVDLTQLTDFLSEIDYIDKCSYPIKFKVNNNYYEAGITRDEMQYLINLDTDEVITLEDPDWMAYEEIQETLEAIFKGKKTATLFEEDSFYGYKRELPQ